MSIFRRLFPKLTKAASIPMFGPGGSRRSTRLQRITLSGSSFDYATEAGQIYDNGVVLPVINWKSRRISEARLIVQELDSKSNKWIEAKPNPGVQALLSCFTKPNDYYGSGVLWRGMQLSWDVRGNIYLIKRRDQVGRLIGFWYIPHNRIRPVIEPGPEIKLVSFYEYIPYNGALMRVEPEEIVHLRFGSDPMDPATGLSPLAAQLRDICTDNEISNWLASLVRDGATPAQWFVPKPGMPAPTNEQKKSLLEWIASFKRDRRGEAAIMPLPMDIMPSGFNPKDMELGKLREIPTSRICAALGVDAMVLGFPSESKTYSNLEEAADGAVKGTVIPDIREWADQLGCLLGEKGINLDPAKYRLAWDVSGISFLADDTDDLHTRVREDYKAGVIDRYRSKELLGETPDDADKGIYATDLKPLPFGGEPQPKPLDAPKKAIDSSQFIYRHFAPPELLKDVRARVRRNPVEFKDDRGRSLQEDYTKLEKSITDKMQAVTARLESGDISASEWGTEIDGLIREGHSKAYSLGRQLAGDPAKTSAADEAAGRRMADLESEYLQGFVTDLLAKDARYFEDDKLKTDAIDNRTDLYAKKMRGTANDAFVDSSDEDEEWDWVLGGAEHHCTDCPFIADGSPYTVGTLYTTPGAGETMCLGNCRCHLIRASDGRTGFTPTD